MPWLNNSYRHNAMNFKVSDSLEQIAANTLQAWRELGHRLRMDALVDGRVVGYVDDGVFFSA